MKRPVLHMAISFAVGIIAAWYIRQVLIILLIFFLGMIGYGYSVHKKRTFIKPLFLWGIFFLLGYLNFALQYTGMLAPLQPYYGEKVVIKGFVQDIYSSDTEKTTFHFHAENLAFESGEQSVSRTVRINAYHCEEIVLGERLEIRGSIKKPEGARNPGGFNSAAWLFSKKAAATMSVDEENVFRTGERKSLPVKALGYKVREHVIGALRNILTDEKAALMTAMLTGYRENLTQPMEEAFRVSGLMHIMAVSGAHIAFLLLPLLWLFKMLGIHRKAAAAVAVPVVISYCFVTGMGASVLRASMMAGIVLMGKLLGRKADLMNSIGIASFALLLVNPFMFFDIGFQLSVGAVIGLALLYPRVQGCMTEKIPRLLRKTLSATIAAQAGILPLLIQSFSKVSLVGVFSNLFVVPLTGLATVTGMMAVIFEGIHRGLGSWIGYFLQGILHMILVITDFFASIPWAEVNMYHLKLPWFILYYAGLIVVGVYGSAFFIRNRKMISTGFLVMGLFLVVEGLCPDRMKVTFIDVGQGDSAFVRTSDGFSLLIDGGGSYNEKETGYIGEQVLLPLLMHEGIPHIDQVLVTHAHADHLDGMISFMKRFPVKSAGLPDYPGVYEDFSELVDICREKGVNIQLYSGGDILPVGEKTVFRVMHPSEGFDDVSNLNNTSLSGFLEFGELQILFAGDMEQPAERAFLRGSGPMDCDILKVAHHGGKNSTSEQFLLRTMPEVSVISVGKNHFGHPSEVVLERLVSAGTKIYTTVQNGAIIVESNGRTIWIKTWFRDEKFTFLFQDG